MLRNIYNMIVNMIKRAKVVSVDDSGANTIYTVSFLGKTQKVIGLTPYGDMYNPPVGSKVLLLTSQAQESNMFGIAHAPSDRLLKNLQPGERAIGNYETGDYIYFKNDGSIEIKTNKLDINSSDINSGNGTLRKLITDIARDVYNSHTHPGGGTPAPQMDSSVLTTDTEAS